VTVNDPSSHEEWVAIGERIRTAREHAGLSVRELARRVEVSPSHVSQVERGLASFSVRALYNVVSELGVSMDSLFGEAVEAPPAALPVAADAPDRPAPEHLDALEQAGVVLRAHRRPSLPLAGGTRWERLTPLPETGAEFIEVIYPPAVPGVSSAPADYIRHSSREYGVVVSGVLTVQVGFDQSELRAGDSIAFDSVTPHRFWNQTSEEVRAIWFIWDTPRSSAEVDGGQASRSAQSAHSPDD
jgi:transcriptional regulator with XRE-family HTH domain/mannose-6-phosphate isomerase-like protein (cupin superfamily)